MTKIIRGVIANTENSYNELGGFGAVTEEMKKIFLESFLSVGVSVGVEFDKFSPIYYGEIIEVLIKPITGVLYRVQFDGFIKQVFPSQITNFKKV